MTRKTDQAVVTSWLQDHAPQLKLLVWGGSAKAQSTFLNEDTGYLVVSSFTSVKSRIKDGIKVGHRVSKHDTGEHIESAIVAYLKDHCPHISLIKCAPQISDKSLFLNTDLDRIFEFSFSNLRYQIEQGYDVGVGLVEAGRRTSDAKQTDIVEAVQWLAEYCPHLTLRQWAGTLSGDSVFYSEAQDREVTASLKNVKVTVQRGGIPFGPYSRSGLEALLEPWLRSQVDNVVVGKQLSGTLYRPDFVLPDHRLVIECDGLYWHSDTNQPDRQYHQKKLTAYEDAGYRALFFRADELRERFHVVQSIILNALGRCSVRVGARQCRVTEIDPVFFGANHLMGVGSGKCYGLLYNDRVVAGMQVRWIKQGETLDISRFSTALGTSVAGGFSKLLAHVISCYTPQKVRTFIDRRYGTGSYLIKFGFEHQGTHLSFRWTDGGTTSLHRMQFPGDSGYEHGHFKVWDCGQAKWIKEIGDNR